MNAAPNLPKCPGCGAELNAESPPGLCPQCQAKGVPKGHPAGAEVGEAAPAAQGKPTIALSLPIEEEAGDRIGHYKLLQKLGEGGFGAVYMAEQEEPVRRRVALKIIKLGMDTRQVVARFEAERQALAMMDHPNIAKVFDAGTTDTGRPFFVMELVRGIKITDYCDQNNLPTRERLQLFNQVCHAIQHAHQKGIIHRDIKPSNILVTLHDGVPVPKVIDFGIAKATQQRLTDKTLFTAFEQIIGTPAYMSPEQAELSGLDIDTRSDIYSLGVLLYELLTGRPPFDQRDLLREMRRIIREEEPPRPSTRLGVLLFRALARWLESSAGDRTHGAGRSTSDDRVKHTADGRMVYRTSKNRLWFAVFLFVFGGFFVAISAWSEPEDFEAGTPAGGVAIGSLIVAVGVTILLWRNELTLDPAARTYRWVRGVWPFVRRRTGSFEDLSHVRLDFQGGDSDFPAQWLLYLVWKCERRRRFLLSAWPTRGATPAEHDGEWWSERLGVPFQDDTGRLEFRSGMPEPVSPKSGSAHSPTQAPAAGSHEDWLRSLPPLPPRSGMWRRERAGGVEVTVRTGFAVMVFAVVFFLAMVGGALVSYEPPQPSPAWLLWLHTGVFWLSLLMLVPWWFRGDCCLSVDQKQLVVSLHFLGLRIHRRILPWDAITTIDARSDEIRVGLRGVRKPFELGSYLSGCQRLWLIEVVRTSLAHREGQRECNQTFKGIWPGDDWRSRGGRPARF